MIESLSDSELIRLGVQTIGDRHRLREKVKAKSTRPEEFVSENTRASTSGNVRSSLAKNWFGGKKD